MVGISFVVPVSDEEIFKKCFLSSPLLAENPGFQILVQRGFKSASLAFNDAIDRAASDIMVFAHQDVIFPSTWDKQFLARLEEVGSLGIPVGVVGCVGITHSGEPAGHIYRHDREFFPSLPLPAKVEAIDEMLISFHKSSGLRFDPGLPTFSCYGAGICLEARSRNLENFVVDAPCFHQGKNIQGRLPRGEFQDRAYIARKWNEYMPVRTLSGTIDRPRSYHAYRIKQFLRRLLLPSPRPWWADLPQIDPEEKLHRKGTPCPR